MYGIMQYALRSCPYRPQQQMADEMGLLITSPLEVWDSACYACTDAYKQSRST